MALNRSQFFTLSAALILFLALYLGFSTTPGSQKTVERSRAIQAESSGFEALLDDAKAHLKAGELSALEALDQQTAETNPDSVRIAALKKLSGWWFAQGNIPVAGGYAEKVAELEHTDAAWSVAGATYYQALIGQQSPELRDYCGARALKSFESAISLNPESVEHRVNQALVYAENPPKDMPMKAVMLLRELENKFPESPVVYNALGRLAIKTGQWERAIQRLEKAWSLDRKNANTPCLLARAYEGAGKAAQAAEFAEYCQNNQ